MQAILIGLVGAFSLYGFVRWLNPGSRGLTLKGYLIMFALITLLPCLLRIAQMLWLDLTLHRKLTDMARRVAAGETVHVSEASLYGTPDNNKHE